MHHRQIQLAFLCLFALLFLSLPSHGQFNWNPIGPEGGFFKDFAIDPNNPTRVYAGSDDGGGVWKSLDGGSSWSLTTADFPNFTGWHLELDPNNPATIYACDLYGRYGVLKSTNFGNSWTLQVNGLNSIRSRMVSKLAVASTNGDTLFISTGEAPNANNAPRPGDGVFRSDDAGQTWLPMGFQGHPVPCIEHNAGIVFAGVHGLGLHATSDMGATWLTHPDVPTTAEIHQIESLNNFVVAACDSGVYLSANFGINFTNIGLVGNLNFDVLIAQSPGVSVVVSTLTGPQVWNDQDSLWTPVSSPLLDNQLIIGMASHGAEVYMGRFSSTEIVKSTDLGQTWNTLPSTPPVCEIPAVVAVEGTSTLYASLQNSYSFNGTIYNGEALAKSTDGGQNWIRSGPIGHGLDMAHYWGDTNLLYLGTFAQGLFKTTDGSTTWFNVRPGNKLIGDVELDEANPQNLLISELDLGTSTAGTFRSTNAGATWTLTSPIPFNKIAYSGLSGDVYAGAGNGLHFSTDGGQSWSAGPMWLSGENVLEVEPRNNDCFAGTKDGELYWISSNGVLDISGPWSQPVEVKNITWVNDNLIVGLNGAEQDTSQDLNGSVWRSSDFGTNWTEITGDLTNTNVFGGNGFAHVPGALYVATYGGGIFEADGTVLPFDGKGGDARKPLVAHPNPMRVSTKVDLGEWGIGKNELVIRDVQGRVVRMENEVVGTEQVILREKLKAGVYLLELRVDGVPVSSGKMVVE